MSSLNPRKTISISGNIETSEKTLSTYISEKYINISHGLWQVSVSQISIVRKDKNQTIGLLELSSKLVTGFRSINPGQSEKNYPVLRKLLVKPSNIDIATTVNYDDKFFLVNNPTEEFTIYIQVKTVNQIKESINFFLDVTFDFVRIQ